jgi:hypothetical protein
MIDADAVVVRHDPVRRPIDIRYPGRCEVEGCRDVIFDRWGVEDWGVGLKQAGLT